MNCPPVLPVYPSAQSVRGNIDREHFDADLWPKKMIEVFAIDTAKTHKNFIDQVVCDRKMIFAKTPKP